MGGVIARYALADMEDDTNLDHDTRLYISHDAPHQGANIPLGIQYFARHLSDQFIGTPLGDYSFEVANDSEASIEELNSLFNEPGTQQLLSNYITPNFALDTNSMHDDWMADLQSKGYPTQTRNIAISNGSHCANTQDYDYNASLFRMNGNARTGVLTDLYSFLIGGADEIALAILFDEPSLILGVLPGSSQFDLDFNAKALPEANTAANIYKGKVSYTKKLFWFLNITVNLTDRSYNNPVNLSYDKYAGGRYELFRGIDPIDFFDDNDDLTQFQADMLNALVGSANIDFNVEQTFGFIPTPSALDVGSSSTILNDDDYFRPYNAANPPTGNLEIPFQNFISAYDNNSSENEEHISFNFRNGDWLAAELVENEQFFNCSWACGDVSITASSALCTSATFSVPEGADSVAWSVSPSNSGVSITSGQGTNEVTLSLSGGYSGQITLTAEMMSEQCGDASTTLTIWTGKPSTPNPIVGPASVNTGALVNYTSGGSSGATSYQWWLPYPYETVPTFNYFGQNWQKLTNASSSASIQVFTGYAGNSGYVQVMGKNSCGVGGARTLYVSHSGGGGHMPRPASENEGYKFIAYPNPTKDLLIVDALEVAKGELSNTAVSGQLYDLNGKVQALVNFTNNKAKVNTDGLEKGVYVLKVYYKDTIETHQIIVE